MRAAGILLHISCLPSKYGIGNLGEEAFRFIDFLADSGNKYWQFLPLCPTSFGDSPYQSASVFAGNPYFIDIDDLILQGLLTKEQAASFNFGKSRKVNFANQYAYKYRILELAFEKFNVSADYCVFVEKNAFWLEDYSFFMALKTNYGGKVWNEWENCHKNHEKFNFIKAKFAKQSEFFKFIQFVFWTQFMNLKRYANERGIGLIGDMPIYAAYDSADVWANNELFSLDAELLPSAVAGCPPDAFSDDGQYWGNPLYNWQKHLETGFDWWKERIGFALKVFDKVRIDHFRGFSAFYAIPKGETTGRNGKWIFAPGAELFGKLKDEIPSKRIIAEDLGVIDDDVRKLLRQTGFDGMKVLQFAFDNDPSNSHLPVHHVVNGVVYTATHDNKTSRGWFEALNDDQRACFAKICNWNGQEESAVEKLIATAMASKAETVIVPIQDYMNLSDKARFNSPSTTRNNWVWRLPSKYATPKLRKAILSQITNADR